MSLTVHKLISPELRGEKARKRERWMLFHSFQTKLFKERERDGVIELRRLHSENERDISLQIKQVIQSRFLSNKHTRTHTHIHTHADLQLHLRAVRQLEWQALPYQQVTKTLLKPAPPSLHSFQICCCLIVFTEDNINVFPLHITLLYGFFCLLVNTLFHSNGKIHI